MRIERPRVSLYSLEFFLTDLCNLRCAHCSASSPYLSNRNFPDLDEFETALELLGRVLHSEQIKFLGGEPLLNPSICSFLRVARKSGVFDTIRVATNGILLPRMTDEFWELADIVEVSRYPGVVVQGPEVEESLRERASKHGTVLEVNEVGQFMITTSLDRIQDPKKIQEIFSMCAEAREWSCHLLYRGRIYRCSRVHTLDRYLDEAGVEHAPFTELDGLPIDGRAELRDDLAAYLQSEKPLRACEHCLGTSGRFRGHRQLGLGEIRDRKSSPPDTFRESDLVSLHEAQFRRRIITWSEASEMLPPER